MLAYELEAILVTISLDEYTNVNILHTINLYQFAYLQLKYFIIATKRYFQWLVNICSHLMTFNSEQLLCEHFHQLAKISR